MVKQGEVYWVDFGEPQGSGVGYRRPAVIVQNNLANESLVPTVIVCPVTSNLRYSRVPGCVTLDAGEANLPYPSLVRAVDIIAIDKKALEEPIGKLGQRRTRAVIEAIKALIEPREPQ